ncbi:MAG TPA: RDD family protein [Frankiaceae bacterium]|nr:RDD family protein [Frankiaceae bacterium]
MSQLVTGEAVLLHLRPARIASRILARALDIGIELVALWVMSLVTSLVAVGDADIGFALGLITAVLFMVGYPVLFETFWRGLTPGKAALGLRVVRDDGGPIRFRHALTRGLLNLVDLWLTFASVGVITSLLSKRGKRTGDIVAGTFVIQERVPRQHIAPVYMPSYLAPWAATLDLSRLPDDLALAVRGFLGRAGALRPEARDRLGAELAAAVGSCVTPPPPQGTPGWAYLSAVVAERRRRDEARVAGRTASLAASGGGPTPWQQSPGPGWSGGGTGPGVSPWPASAPPTGSPPSVGPPPPLGSPPHDPGPPRLPSAPSPQWGPAPVPPSAPPGAPADGGAPDTARRSRTPGRGAPDEPARPAAPAGGFAAPD